VRDAEEQFRAAKVANDAAALTTLLDDAVTETNQNGSTRNKAAILAALATNPITALTTRIGDVRVSKDVANVTGSQIETSGTGVDRVLFTRVWRNDGGTWKLLSSSQFRDPRLGSAASGASDELPYRRALTAEASTPGAPVRVGGDIKEPKKLRDVKPAYPPDALASRIQGIVIIEAVIDEQGNVSNARILRSQPMLDQAALDAVRQWKFTTTELNGVAVPVIMTVTVNFSLQ